LDFVFFAAHLSSSVGYSITAMLSGSPVFCCSRQRLVKSLMQQMRLLRKEGTVKKGESIALLGSSGGSSTGPHLHFEIWRESKPVDPREFIFALQRDQSSVEM